MADSIPSVFGRAVGVYQGDDHYNQIAVLEQGNADVLYVGTDRGNVIKMVNLNGTKTVLKDDSVLKVATYKVSEVGKFRFWWETSFLAPHSSFVDQG